MAARFGVYFFDCPRSCLRPFSENLRWCGALGVPVHFSPESAPGCGAGRDRARCGRAWWGGEHLFALEKWNRGVRLLWGVAVDSFRGHTIKHLRTLAALAAERRAPGVAPRLRAVAVAVGAGFVLNQFVDEILLRSHAKGIELSFDFGLPLTSLRQTTPWLIAGNILFPRVS